MKKNFKKRMLICFIVSSIAYLVILCCFAIIPNPKNSASALGTITRMEDSQKSNVHYEIDIDEEIFLIVMAYDDCFSHEAFTRDVMVNDQISVRYNKVFNEKRLCEITVNGITYLSLDDCQKIHNQNIVICSVAFGVIIGIGGAAVIMLFRKKRNNETDESFDDYRMLTVVNEQEKLPVPKYTRAHFDVVRFSNTNAVLKLKNPTDDFFDLEYYGSYDKKNNLVEEKEYEPVIVNIKNRFTGQIILAFDGAQHGFYSLIAAEKVKARQVDRFATLGIKAKEIFLEIDFLHMENINEGFLIEDGRVYDKETKEFFADYDTLLQEGFESVKIYYYDEDKKRMVKVVDIFTF